ncbi:MAG: DUF302 domain-containing protein [Bacteroidales bacterium]|nr:DUF302 domain-containing protein [Bacteroidales bacterium]
MDMIIIGIAGILTGIIFTVIVIYTSLSSLVLKEDISKFNFEQTEEELQKAISEMGWKIPKIHDLQETMEKFGKPAVRKVKVYEICHPDHAHEILSRDNERIVSSMLPCRISIYEKSDGKVYISRMNTSLMGRVMKGVVPKVMQSATVDSEKIISSLLR